MRANMRLYCRGHRHVVFLHQVQEPLDGDAPPERIVNVPQRLKAGCRAPEVIPAAAQEQREEPPMAVEIKELRLGVRILEPHRPQPVPQRALATAGTPEHEEM